MTIDEIFEQLASHMLKGAMLHDDLANYYDFLNLQGYKRCHEYHFKHELNSYRHICRYYLNHYNKLLKYEHDYESIIPLSWYRYKRYDVDGATKRNAVKTAIEKWVSWESETKDFYQQLYNELISLNEIASAKKLMHYICDVDHELKTATCKHLTLKSMDYDLSFIIFEQDKIHKKYHEQSSNYK